MNTDEDLTYQIDECKSVIESFVYFLDKYVYIEDKELNRAIKLELWPAQREIIPQLTTEQLLILLKTRQVGLTWLTAALIVWLGITKPLHLSIIISASEDHAIEFINRVYFILDRLPSFLVPPVKTRTKQVCEFLHQDNLISTIKSMPTIEMGAESKTPNVLVIDEAHTIRSVQQIFNSSYPGIEQAKGRVIIIANSVKSGAGWSFVRDLYTASMKGINRFKRIFLAWTAHPLRPKNFRAMMEDAGMTKEDVIEHYPETEEEAIAAASGSFFGSDIVRHNDFKSGVKGDLIRNKEKEIDLLDNKQGIVELWHWPYYLVEGWNRNKWERRYAIGSDVGEGLGEDYSVAYVYDRKFDRIVCRMRSNRIDAYTWGTLLYRLSLWYDKALIAVERNGSGITTIKRLEALKANQYVRINAGKIGKAITKEYGWLATGGANGTKYELCGDLRTWFKKTKSTIYCPILIDEASTFIRFENGTLGAEIGKHDDCVIAGGLTIQADKYLGEPAKEIIPKGTGWRDRLKDEAKGSVWAH
ncbi:MAG: hypothetical protein PHS33_08045 [Candidatus Omnitrophica bacterium]|nr:hypothetical protein [Candidatus Omnitrophota bacterium]MDD5264703.1 hypothetical protein [Candidatus Bipolaricaulis sp.]